MPIEASFFIDGNSQQIILENMQLWHNIANASQIIITAKTTHSITVQHCILSTVAVKRSTMLNAYAGNPRSWNNGIRMLGNNGQIINNNLINLNLAISQTGPNTLVKHNHIQFYTEDAIRVSHHGVKIEHNTIYDSVMKRTGQNAHKDAIQLIPPEDRFNGGALNNITITGNIIQSNSAAVANHEHGTVQGIFGSDGHFVNTTITDNIIAVNSDHGITLNGVKNARISNNRILDQTPTDHFQPGIKLYLTRISKGGKQSWLATLSYSVHLSGNQAAILNIPNEAYTVKDVGDNRIKTFSHNLTRGNSAIIIRNNRSASVTRSLLPAQQKSLSAKILPQQKTEPEEVKAKPNKKTNATHKKTVYTINNKTDLTQAITQATEGDTLLINKAGNYGTIRLRHKKGICLKAADNHLTINAHILIEGKSHDITLENMNLWYSENNWKPVILSTPSTHHIQIKNCLISSVAVTPNNATKGLAGQIAQWITGIWLRGTHNHIKNNQIVNTSTGITASGCHTQIENNLIQFYTEKGIRIFNHDIQVQHNTLYDAVNKPQGKHYNSTAIQLTPPEERFAAGELKNITISSNTIQLSSPNTTVAKHMQGNLQGITGKDGYMIDMLINDNIITTNTEHGIVLCGASKLTLTGNKVFNHEVDAQLISGIRLYYTRTIDIKGSLKQVWQKNRSYSVSYSDNSAPVFNIPNEGYQSSDKGGNHFGIHTTEEGRGKNPMVV
jgi:parallel beta-helix repeat protein